MARTRTPLVWTVAALVLWFLAAGLDRTTVIEVHSDGHRLHLEVAGTTLSAPIGIVRLFAIEIRAMDSIDPPSGVRLGVADGRGETVSVRLPRRLPFPPGVEVPFGDWELDENAGHGVVWTRPLTVSGPFTVTATFRGRFHHDLELVLDGEPGASVAVRRGLINHDAFIRTADGVTRATSSIDPTPASDLGAIAATALRAAALASAIAALLALLDAVSRPAPKPAAARRWRSAPWVAVAAVSAVAVSAWFAGAVLEGLPHLPDSVSYLMQARWILDGALWGSVVEYQDALGLPYTYVVGERWLPHYPPGWPLLLALGVAVGAPWLIAPLLGGVLVVLLYLSGRELDGRVTGLLAATLGLLSPIMRILCGSMLSHTAAATFILAGLWLVLRSRRLGSWPGAAAAGVSLGLAFGIRPLSAVATALPLAVMMFRDLVTRRDTAARDLFIGWLGGGFAAALPTLMANRLITGSAIAFPYSLADGSMYLTTNLPFGIRNLDVLLYTAGNLLHGWGWPVFHGPFWVALGLALALVPFLLRRAKSGDVLLVSVVAAVAIAHLGSRGHGLHGFGPRYLFEAVPPLVLLTARGFVEAARSPANGAGVERRLRVVASALLFVVLCGTAAASLPLRLALYRGYNRVDRSLERQVATHGLTRAVVLLPSDDWRGWAESARLMSTDPDPGLLFIQVEPNDPEVREIAGDRPIFAWRDRNLVPVEAPVETVER